MEKMKNAWSLFRLFCSILLVPGAGFAILRILAWPPSGKRFNRAAGLPA
jgi:hypothetical protein